MSFFKKIKFNSVLIGVLLLLNAVCIYFLALHHRILSNRPHEHRMESPMRPMSDHNEDRMHSMRFLTRALQLTQDQKDRIHELRGDFMSASGNIKKSIKEDRISIYNMSVNDSLAVKQKITEIGQQHEKLESLLYNHFSAIRSICTDEQKERYDEIIEKVIIRFGPPEPRHHKKIKHKNKRKRKNRNRRED